MYNLTRLALGPHRYVSTSPTIRTKTTLVSLSAVASITTLNKYGRKMKAASLEVPEVRDSSTTQRAARAVGNVDDVRPFFGL